MNVSQNFKIATIIFLITTLFSFKSAIACTHNHFDYFDCDLCGCTTISGSSGFGTLGNVSFVGLRYIYQNFESRNGVFSNSPLSEEQFNTYQLWGKIPVNDNIYINAIVPYQDLYRKTNQATEHINGLGDVTVMGWYQFQFFKKKTDDDVQFNTDKEASNHKLNVGLGLKLPTGEFEEQFADRINPGFRVGTGSLDAIISLMHIYTKDRFGVNTTVSYYFKNENKNDYRFGNQLSYASNVFYNVPFKQSALNPFIGLSADVYDAIEQFNETLPDTDGHIINGTFGTEFMIDKFVMGANYTFPISQDLFGDNVKAQNRFSVFVNYVL